jgi:hypothetical protein
METNPNQLNFVHCEADAEYRYNAITTLLHEHQCIVDFTKLDGESRTMPCTLRSDLMPVATQVLKEDIVDRPINYETITVWCTDKQAWRAMKTMNVLSVKVVPTSWTMTVEQDPETGDILLPLPPDVLTMRGWNEGDTLEWTDNGDGSWSLTKVDHAL